MKKKFNILGFFAGLSLCASLGFSENTYPLEVLRVYDGDTVIATIGPIDILDGALLPARRIRLLGINAPEIRGQVDKQLGYASREYLKQILAGHPLRIELKSKPPYRDNFGRLLAWVYYQDGRGWNNANFRMIRGGHAEPYMLGEL